MPRVSVVVSHYERQALLVEALDSIAAQSYRDFEIVVVNDAGADSEAVVRDAAARHPGLVVRYQRQPVNRGVAATRNAGVALADGELIAYLDDDDLWRRHHLASLVGALDAHPDAALAYGDAEIWRMECDHAPRVDEWRCAARRTLAVPFDLDHLRRDDFVVPGAWCTTARSTTPSGHSTKRCSCRTTGIGCCAPRPSRASCACPRSS
jgi:glycosyltransferase involved in cell wall biosynthesis